MPICPDIFQNSPLTICFKTPRVVAEQRSADGKTSPHRDPSILSRTATPVEKTRWALPRSCLSIHICVCFHTLKSGFHLLKINVLIFVRICSHVLLSHYEMCHFWRFSPLARVSKMSLDCSVCISLQCLFVCFLCCRSAHKKKSGLFFLQICEKNRLVIVQMNDFELIRVSVLGRVWMGLLL